MARQRLFVLWGWGGAITERHTHRGPHRRITYKRTQSQSQGHDRAHTPKTRANANANDLQNTKYDRD